MYISDPTRCRECSKEFMPIRSTHVYCSVTCQSKSTNQRARNKPTMKTCKVCKKVFVSVPNKAYCSIDCRNVNEKKVKAERRKKKKRVCRVCGLEPTRTPRSQFCQDCADERAQRQREKSIEERRVDKTKIEIKAKAGVERLLVPDDVDNLQANRIWNVMDVWATLKIGNFTPGTKVLVLLPLIKSGTKAVKRYIPGIYYVGPNVERKSKKSDKQSLYTEEEWANREEAQAEMFGDIIE